MQVGTVTGINPGSNPSIVINQNPEAETPVGSDHDSKYVHFKLPTAWNVGLGATTVRHPGQDPNVTMAQSSTTKTFTFALPKVWDVQLGPNAQVPINPGLSPSVSISYDSTTAGTPATENSDVKYLYFKLPKAWQFRTGTITQQVNPGTSASADWSYDINSITRKDPTENDNTVYLHFKIPNAWDVQLGSVTAALPDATPEVVVNQTNSSGQSSQVSKYLHFTLPVSQSFQDVTITPLGPLEQPSANLVYAASDTVHKYPTIALRLPAAIKTLYGSALMRTENYTIRPNVDTADYNAVRDLSIGDYYINTTLAAVHRISAIDANNGNISTTYEGTMQLSIPTITANAVNPYDANGNPTQPRIVTSTTTSPVNSWNVNVDTLVAPIFQNSGESGFVASTATGEISSRASNQYVTWTFKIPRGTKLTTSSRVPDKNTIKSTSLDGDMYLDSIGALYVYTGSGTTGDWSSAGSLKGNSFQVKNSSAISVTENDLLPYSGTFYEKIGAYIDANYSSMMSSYKLNEIINVNYQLDVDVWASHWLFKASNGTWSGSQLTGDASNSIIVTDWQSEADDSKAYSVTLINSLRATIASLQSQVASLQAEVDKGWGIMADNGLVPYNPEE